MYTMQLYKILYFFCFNLIFLITIFFGQMLISFGGLVIEQTGGAEIIVEQYSAGHIPPPF